jgi:Rrf2 family transcriptional regulator, cysteine metabolism repressor
MRLTTRSEYACLALMDLAERREEGFVKIGDIARRQRIPRKYLERILLRFQKAGYLASQRGAAGGYALAKPPDRISLAAVVRLMDGPIASTRSVSRYFYAHSPIERSPQLVRFFKEIRDLVAERMERTTLGTLLRDGR